MSTCGAQVNRACCMEARRPLVVTQTNLLLHCHQISLKTYRLHQSSQHIYQNRRRLLLNNTFFKKSNDFTSSEDANCESHHCLYRTLCLSTPCSHLYALKDLSDLHHHQWPSLWLRSNMSIIESLLTFHNDVILPFCVCRLRSQRAVLVFWTAPPWWTAQVRVSTCCTSATMMSAALLNKSTVTVAAARASLRSSMGKTIVNSQPAVCQCLDM